MISQTYEPQAKVTTLEHKFTPPVSSDVKVSTYQQACADFYNKLEQTYKYNTGKNIDLSNFTEDNLGYANSTIYVANYQGKTYRFSDFNTFRSTGTYLEKALTDAGATVTTEKSKIYYIFNNDKSIAIADENGNPVRSGKILEKASNGYEMYNQNYVRQAKVSLEARGIETTNMSESQLVGAFILSPEYNIQDSDLSIALGSEKGALLKAVPIIKDFFKGPQHDISILGHYKETVDEYANSFNNNAKQTENTYSIMHLSDGPEI